MVKFTARLTEEEKNKLDIASEKMKLSKNEIIKLLINNHLDDINNDILIKNELIQEYKNLSFQLKKIGVVLNQANRNFFENKNQKIDEIKKGIDELWQYLSQSKV